MSTVQEKIEAATTWMEKTAKDNSHGYDQIYRWGQKGDYDCSAAVIKAWMEAGVDLKKDGATYTGNLEPALLKNGFVDVTDKVDLKTGKGLKRGDVLLARGHHAAMYAGDGKEVEASINEKGKATGGKPGDQTGREFLIRNYRNYPWTNVYRFVHDDEAKTVVKKTETADTKSLTDTTHFRVTAKNGLNVRKVPNGNVVRVLPYKSYVSYDDDAKKTTGWHAIDKYRLPDTKEWKRISGYCSAQYLEKV